MTELDPRSASPADSAPDEGLSPRAAAEAKKAAAAKAAAAAFIQSAGDDYGNVEAAQPRDVKKGQRTAVIVGLIICVLVAAGGALGQRQRQRHLGQPERYPYD